MNRIVQLDELPPHVTAKADTMPDAALLQRNEERRWHFLWPERFEPRFRYPLLIWLHGCGADESQIFEVADRIGFRNFAMIAPCGTALPQSTGGPYYWQQSTEETLEAFERVELCLREAQRRCRLNLRKVVLAGFADGGTMALRLALLHPELFAGVASLQGPVPTDDRPLQTYPATIGLRVLLSYGRESARYPSTQVAADMAVLYLAGARLHVRQYETDNDLDTIMFRDLNDWIMEAQQRDKKAAEPLLHDIN